MYLYISLEDTTCCIIYSKISSRNDQEIFTFNEDQFAFPLNNATHIKVHILLQLSKIWEPSLQLKFSNYVEHYSLQKLKH